MNSVVIVLLGLIVVLLSLAIETMGINSLKLPVSGGLLRFTVRTALVLTILSALYYAVHLFGFGG